MIFERVDRDYVYLVDPATGRRRVTMERFRQSFTGVALLLEPGEHFETGKAPGPARLPLRAAGAPAVAHPDASGGDVAGAPGASRWPSPC